MEPKTILDIGRTLKNNNVKDTSQPQNYPLSSIYGGGKSDFDLGNGIAVSVVGRRPTNGTSLGGLTNSSQAMALVKYNALDTELESSIGNFKVKAGPYGGFTYGNSTGGAYAGGGSLEAIHQPTGTIVSCDGHFASSSSGPLSYNGSQATPNATLGCVASIRF